MAKISPSDVRDLLLDTHIFVWMATDPDRLPRGFRSAILGARSRYVSLISALEIQIKHAKNARNLPFSLGDFEIAMKRFRCWELPLSLGDIKALDGIESIQPDPFDRVLMAQAANRDICLVTLDENILRTAERYQAFRVLGE